MGKKYIIEMNDECNSTFKGIMAFGITQDKQISVELIQEESMTPYTEPEPHAEVTADAYQRGYEAGLNDKKEGKATCQYCKYEYLDETEEPCKKCCKAYMNKYKPKAKEEQIQVGDEVENTQTGVKFIVTHMWFNNHGEKGVSGFNHNCSAFSTTIELVKKTGRHFPEIAEVLQKMKETNNG